MLLYDKIISVKSSFKYATYNDSISIEQYNDSISIEHLYDRTIWQNYLCISTLYSSDNNDSGIY